MIGKREKFIKKKQTLPLAGRQGGRKRRATGWGVREAPRR